MANKKEIRKEIAENMSGLAVATIEFDIMVPCLAAIDAAAKTADIQIEAVERNRLAAGVCIKMRGRLSELRAALEAAERTGIEAGGQLLAKNLIPAPTRDTEKCVAETMFS